MWRLTPGQTLGCREWQGEYVLYNDLSGDTHLLAEDAVLLLFAIQRGPQDAAALAARLNADYPEANLTAAEVDTLLERGRRTCRQSDRKRVYDRLQEIFAEEQPLVFLYFRDALPAVASRVRGIEPGPIGIDYNTNEWYVPKQLQLYMSE